MVDTFCCCVLPCNWKDDNMCFSLILCPPSSLSPMFNCFADLVKKKVNGKKMEVNPCWEMLKGRGGGPGNPRWVARTVSTQKTGKARYVFQDSWWSSTSWWGGRVTWLVLTNSMQWRLPCPSLRCKKACQLFFSSREKGQSLIKCSMLGRRKPQFQREDVLNRSALMFFLVTSTDP